MKTFIVNKKEYEIRLTIGQVEEMQKEIDGSEDESKSVRIIISHTLGLSDDEYSNLPFESMKELVPIIEYITEAIGL